MRTFAALVMALVLVLPATAREWSAEQQQVWTAVEKEIAAWEDRNVDSREVYLHPDITLWGFRLDVPIVGKVRMTKHAKYNFPNTKVLLSTIHPLVINVYDDAAVVQHSFWMVLEDAAGDRTTVQGGVTKVLVKEGGKWVLAAVHGHRESVGGD